MSVNTSSWTVRLILANVIVFMLDSAIPGLQEKFCLVPVYVFLRPWTVITYMFLHGGFAHILFNMLALFFFGPRLELEIGGRHFLSLYFISGIMGAALSFVFTPYTPIIGASGAIFGVLLGYAHFWPKDQILIWGILPIEARWFVIIMTALSLFSGFTGYEGDVAHFAHLGGFLGGWIYVRLLSRGQRARMIPHEITAPHPSIADLHRWSSIRRDTMHEINREEYDRIMMKIRTMGTESLTIREREFLDRFSRQ